MLLLNDRTLQGSELQLHSIAHGVISLNSSSPAYGQTRRELQVVKFRGSQFISGFHDFTIHKGGITAYPRLVASDHTSAYRAEVLPSGVAALDALMGGGIDRGTSTLLIGPPGSGKSTIALQYAAAAAARGEHAATFVFDETKSALLSRSSGIGMRIVEGHGPGQIAIRQIDPVAISPGEFAHVARDSVEREKARVVINAQSGMIGSNMSSPVDASYLADSVVLLRYFELKGSVRKAISVLKKHRRT